jgi:hypothetical protein
MAISKYNIKTTDKIMGKKPCFCVNKAGESTYVGVKSKSKCKQNCKEMRVKVRI